MVHIWYLYFGDEMQALNPATLYEQIYSEVRHQDPNAVIREIRQYPYQLAVYIEHPTWTARTISGKKAFVETLATGEERLIAPIIVAYIIIGIAAIITAAGYLLGAVGNYVKEHRTYFCPGDPSRPPTEQCALHTDAEGNPLQFSTYTEWMAHLSVAHTSAAEYIQTREITPWWEGVTNILILVMVLVGMAIILPPIIGLFRKKKE